MPKLYAVTQCPKCGTHRLTNTHTGHLFPVQFNALKSTNKTTGDLFEGEHITVTCPSCNYTWAERPLDWPINEKIIPKDERKKGE